MNIAVIGLGYVGSVTAVMLQSLSHRVTAYDIEPAKRDRLRDGTVANSEPELQFYLERSSEVTGGIRIVDDFRSAVIGQDCVFVCVGTPSSSDGTVDTFALSEVIGNFTKLHDPDADPYWIVVRSTALPPQHQFVRTTLPPELRRRYVVHPEFLREGSAVQDFLNADVQVFGADAGLHDELRMVAKKLYRGMNASAEFFMSVEEAALSKYASNLFHAAKITFANEIGEMSREFGADARNVMSVLSHSRLSTSPLYMRPGLPYGGSCLPKDTRAISVSKPAQNLPLIHAVNHSNRKRIEDVVIWVNSRVAPNVQVGIYGLAFKEGTDDCRESVPLKIAMSLLGLGRAIVGYDPLVLQDPIGHERFSLTNSLSDLDGCDVILVCHAGIDHEFVRDKIVFDAVGNDRDLQTISEQYQGLYW